jgi:NAD(P)-dependent dehydrogenase (short-subunit alcohol dehydrogenase family)
MTPPPTMTGKTCLVTGATSGIGLVTAEALARAGATVIVVGRDPARCEATAAKLRQLSGGSEAVPLPADLSSQGDIHRLAGQVRERFPRVDVLLNNAGAMFVERIESVDGIEKTWALNHLGYFLLTNLLLDTLKSSAPARVVNVASSAHRSAPGIDFDDPEAKARRYKPFPSYAQSKLANVMFTYELARRLEGTGVTANVLHPGFVATSFFNGQGWLFRLLKLAAGLVAVSPETGAMTSIDLATSPDVEGLSGRYYERSRAVASSRASMDVDAAIKLWRLSEQQTKRTVTK